MRVPIGMDLVSWILGWNKVIKVLRPVELREKVLAKAKEIIKMYKK
jgi:predicted DNA-binding transcriptional regulator YafY